jgi:hypothetical protein
MMASYSGSASCDVISAVSILLGDKDNIQAVVIHLISKSEVIREIVSIGRFFYL